jgi:hypothetical protein
MHDGYSTKIAFAVDPDVALWEKTVKPPGLDGGDPIDTTTMHNSTYRTSAPRALVTLTESTFEAGYDPVVYTQLLAILNVQTSITVHFPDGGSLAFFGFLKMFEPSDLTEGEFPTASVTIVPTNVDPVNCVEASPVLVEGTGTC